MKIRNEIIECYEGCCKMFLEQMNYYCIYKTNKAKIKKDENQLWKQMNQKWMKDNRNQIFTCSKLEELKFNNRGKEGNI